jgi:predicted secreted protein
MKKNLAIILILILLVSFGQLISKPKGKVFNDIKKPIVVKVGEEFTIKLQSNHTTGYEWMLVEEFESAPIEFVDKEYITKKAPKMMTGVGGFEYWKFKAVKKGLMILKMKEARPSDPSGPASVSLAFNIEVK